MNLSNDVLPAALISLAVTLICFNECHAEQVESDSSPQRILQSVDQNTPRFPMLRGGAEEMTSPINSVQWKHQYTSPRKVKTSTDRRANDASRFFESEASSRNFQLKTNLNKDLDIDLREQAPRSTFVPKRFQLEANTVDKSSAPLKDLDIDLDKQKPSSAEFFADTRGFSVKNGSVPTGELINSKSSVTFGAPRTSNIMQPRVNEAETIRSEPISDRPRLGIVRSMPDLTLRGQLRPSGDLVRVDIELAKVKSDLEIVFKRPSEADCAESLNGELLGHERNIGWDTWYARFAGLIDPILLNEVENSGGPAGSNTVLVTVTSDQVVRIRLEQSGNSEFDKATLKAYRSLDGNSSLTFPARSKRRIVTFSVDNVHAHEGSVSSVESRPLKGDRE